MERKSFNRNLYTSPEPNSMSINRCTTPPIICSTGSQLDNSYMGSYNSPFNCARKVDVSANGMKKRSKNIRTINKEFNSKLQSAYREQECYKLEIEERDREILRLREIIRSFQPSSNESDLKNQLELLRIQARYDKDTIENLENQVRRIGSPSDSISNIKQTYEHKIEIIENGHQKAIKNLKQRVKKLEQQNRFNKDICLSMNTISISLNPTTYKSSKRPNSKAKYESLLFELWRMKSQVKELKHLVKQNNFSQYFKKLYENLEAITVKSLNLQKKNKDLEHISYETSANASQNQHLKHEIQIRDTLLQKAKEKEEELEREYNTLITNSSADNTLQEKLEEKDKEIAELLKELQNRKDKHELLAECMERIKEMENKEHVLLRDHLKTMEKLHSVCSASKNNQEKLGLLVKTKGDCILDLEQQIKNKSVTIKGLNRQISSFSRSGSFK